MMDQNQWKKLHEAFTNEDIWKDGDVFIDDYVFDLTLFDWLECDSFGPSREMERQLDYHGYNVFKLEGDSFGWLIGGIRRKGINEQRCITFG